MEAPKIPSLFGMKFKKPNRFYFEPRYYDERKEKMKKRYERIRKEIESEKQSSSRTNPTELRSEMRENWTGSYSRGASGSQMNSRVIIYVVILSALVYYLFF